MQVLYIAIEFDVMQKLSLECSNKLLLFAASEMEKWGKQWANRVQNEACQQNIYNNNNEIH